MFTPSTDDQATDHRPETEITIPNPRTGNPPGTPTEQVCADPAATTAPRLLLRVEEAADRLSISRTRMFAYLKSGAIESVKVGRLRRIPADALTAFVAHLTADQSATAA